MAKTYEIAYRDELPPLDPADLAAWDGVTEGRIDQWPWPQRVAEKRATTFRAVWSDAGLALRYDCEDRHISARATEPNGYVWQDSCVEFFVAPNPRKPLNYYNFEINCVGTVLMGTHCDWAEGYADRSLDIGIRVATSVPGPTRDESPDDDGWQLVAHIPWEHFELDAPHLPPKPGDRWRANFYRIGGQTNPQCSAWAPIDHQKPQFHLPQFFAPIVFVK